MGLLGMESFDLYTTGDVTDYFVSVGTGAIVAAAGRCGSAAWQGTAAGGSGPSAGITTAVTSGFVGFAYKPTATNSTGTLALASTGSGAASNWAFINVESNGSISLWKGVNQIIGTLLTSTAASLISLNHYAHIGVEFKQGASGYLRVYVNGVLAADTGTVDMTAGFTDGLPWGRIDFTPIGYIDDLYWGDTDSSDSNNPSVAFLGDLRVEGSLAVTDASASGTYHEFTLSTGSDQGALVDENPPNDDTDYVSSGTLNQRATFRFTTITPLSGTIYGVQLMPNALKTTFADRSIATAVVSSGSLVIGTNQAVAQTTYRYYPQVYGYNPVTSSAWSVSEVNAMEGGIKVTV